MLNSEAETAYRILGKLAEQSDATQRSIAYIVRPHDPQPPTMCAMYSVDGPQPR